MIVVAGMHRSGTSAIAELLGSLGLDLGDRSGLFAPDRWNERGYFEQRDVLDVNSEIVTGLPRTRSRGERWAGQLVYLGMPSRARMAARARRCLPRMRELAARYSGRLVKDPRFCLTLPDWSAHDAVESLVVCVRNPAEVVDSLWRRQHVPRWLGLRFWNYHVAALLAAVGPIRTHFVDYEALLRGGTHELDRLDAFFSLGLDAAERQRRCASVIDRDLRHCRAPAADLPPRTLRLYAELRARCNAQPVPEAGGC